jgi:hypothetical protein
MNDFSLNDLRAVLGAVPPEPVAPDRAAAVRRRVRQVRQRRSVVGAVALAVPAASLGVLRGYGDGGGPQLPSYPAATSPSRQPGPGGQTSPPVAVRSATVTPHAPAPGQAPALRPTKTGPTRPTGGRPGPGLVVTLVASATEVRVGEDVAFTVNWSDTDGHYEGYEMSYGDIGASSYEKVICAGRAVHPETGQQHFTHAWSEPGTYHVYYSVRTGDCGATGETGTGAVDVIVLPADAEPPPTGEPEPTPSAEPGATAPA